MNDPSRGSRVLRARSSSEKNLPDAPDDALVKATKTDRIRWIVGEMGAARWRPGVSHQEAMAKFGVVKKTIEEDAAEASRYVREVVGTSEELKALCTAGLHQAMKMATEASDKARGSSALTQAIVALAGLHGLEPPKNLNVNAGVTLADFLKIATVPETK